MAQSLSYTVVNASRVTLAQEVDVPGIGLSTVNFERAVIEATPNDHMGGTFSMTLPIEALDEFPKGATLNLKITAIAPEAPTKGA